jgi:hypothetical protein
MVTLTACAAIGLGSTQTSTQLVATAFSPECKDRWKKTDKLPFSRTRIMNECSSKHACTATCVFIMEQRLIVQRRNFRRRTDHCKAGGVSVSFVTIWLWEDCGRRGTPTELQMDFEYFLNSNMNKLFYENRNKWEIKNGCLLRPEPQLALPRTVVNMRTTCFNFQNSVFCARSVLRCFVLSQNRARLFPYTTLLNGVFNVDAACLLWGVSILLNIIWTSTCRLNWHYFLSFPLLGGLIV